MPTLRGITWDHVRGVAPLIATTQEFQKSRPSFHIEWDKRSLKDFEDYPIDVLAEKYDLIMLDHPCIGTAVQKKVLLPLDDWVPKEFLADQKRNSVGPSYDSYTWEGRQWALAVDTAAQVAAYRPDLLERTGHAVPATWDDVFALATALSGSGTGTGLKIGMPLNPTHAFLSFMSLGAHLAGGKFLDDEAGVNGEAAEEALNLLKKLVPHVHGMSLASDPIQMLDRMGETDEIVYVPLIYGYVNYSLEGFRKHPVIFTDIPVLRGEPSGSVIGGVGLAISAKCRAVREAVEYAMYVASGDCQKGLYFASGGQPGHREAWLDEQVNRLSRGFFRNTLKTLDLSYVRPRFPGYLDIQEKAGEVVREFLLSSETIDGTVRKINGLYRESKKTV